MTIIYGGTKNMDLELMKLYNTLLTIETKGESTLIMADCLRFIKQLQESVKEPIVSENN